MSFVQTVLAAGERVAWPDVVTRLAIAGLVDRTSRRLRTSTASEDEDFARAMLGYPIAEHTDAANAQHYEVPAEFFEKVLGPRRKYSSCLYDRGAETLAEAEDHALEDTAANAGLADGQRILELGCGWGSLSLWMARRYPAAHITAVSNSHSQRAFITQRAADEGLENLDVVTADMNTFMPNATYDRVVSVEMFEHMANWRPLLERMRDCLTADGRLFMHVFTHRSASYRFSNANTEDWIAQHFFTGGIMPSRDLITHFPELFSVEAEVYWSGVNYAHTANDWLANFDRNWDDIAVILSDVYGVDAPLWRRRWRLFFLATAGLFGHAGGQEWGVCHYRLKPATR